jgi:hypothetical protein
MDTDAEQAKPYWVVLRFGHLFVAGHETHAEAEAHAARLNQQIPAPPGHPPHYLVIPRPMPFFSEE